MVDAQSLLEQIGLACQRMKMAPSTFGRLAVNDGKLVTRLQQGGKVTLQTVERVHRFIEESGGATVADLRTGLSRLGAGTQLAENFRFYQNRHKYLMFVNTTNEKQMIADRAVEEVCKTQPSPPAIRMLDAGAGDGTALARMLRGLHRRHPWVPFYVVAKEISMENVRLTLEKMPDRLREHSASVIVLTNLKYSEAGRLQPLDERDAARMVWKEMPLEGTSAGEFEEQISSLEPFLTQHWQTRIAASGNPMYRTPCALVLYRKDHAFMLDPIVPRPGKTTADMDFVLLSQPYRARAPLSFKIERVIAPLARSLRANGKLMIVQARGDDPGMEIIRTIWPDENPFVDGRDRIVDALKEQLGPAAANYDFGSSEDPAGGFRFNVRTMPSEIDEANPIGTSTLFGAWNAANYVAQIDDARLARALANDAYLEATRKVLQKHRGLWFNDEVFTICRRNMLH
ncbi:hypothetical protein [Novosphingobium aquimarinum]|uniref:hypothetical protein n=1 Tax=Novosphingobium aquimarinum TaxID=2682494 RepID=UPI0018DE6E30|nr:hypothetical protein [Novosphingobium aquimarinum]